MNRLPKIKKTSLVIVIFCLAYLEGISQIDARLIRDPDVSETEIVFSYGGDLWIVPKQGGTARHLTSPKGEEKNPKFSPDGKTIAFSGYYDGNADIYAISTKGGIPVRITHHPSPDFMIDWYPDNENILFKSRMGCANNKTNSFYKTSKKGGFPEKLPIEIGEEASLSPDGNFIAFNMMPTIYGGAWKRYRGGAASEIWLFNLKTYASENISNFEGVDNFPMWSGDKIYFISDRDENKKENIWVYNLQSKQIKQLTFFKEHDTHFPSIGPKDIVFENGGKLYLMDIQTEKIKEVSVCIEFNSLSLKPKQVEVSNLIANVTLSPSGNRIIAEARGELFSLPATEGAVLNLTRTSGVAEKFPSWSPDGKLLAYFTDKDGEYQLAIRPLDGEEKIPTHFKNGYRYTPFWSPDNKKLVFVDEKMNINLYDLESNKNSIIDNALWSFNQGLDAFRVAWSANGQWICWSKGLENHNNGIFVYNLANKELTQVSSGFYDDSDPVFDADGNYLYYFSKRTLNAYNSDIQPTWIFANTTNLVALPLTKKTASPLAIKNDVDEVKKELERDTKNNIFIDFEKLEERSVILPLKAGNYSNLESTPGGLTYIKRAETGSSEQNTELAFFDLKSNTESNIIEHIFDYQISFDKKKILVQKSRNQYAVINISSNQTIKKTIPVNEMEMIVNPRDEWMQIYNEAWRYMRDFFYDPEMHGMDWDKIGERYRSLVPFAGNREDLNYIILQMIGEVGSGHVGVRGGEIEEPESTQVGLLGVDFEIENGVYRIKKIYNSGYRQSEFRSPLNEPGIDVKEGDYILAVNGIPLTIEKDPWAPFVGLSDKTVILTVNNSPEIKGSRDIVIKTLRSEGKLRELNWVRENREKVLKASSGKIGYIYVTNTSLEGQQELVNQFKAQFHLPGLIIDERFNAGGALGDRFVELLNRPLYGYLKVRNGKLSHMPEVAHPGPMALLTNGWAASGGDGFPYFFQKAGLGPLIGQATMGALVGPNQYMPLIDGGIVSPPPSRIYNMNGEWDGAQTGVIPDIKIINDPESLAKGRDIQLEKAIEIILNKLKNSNSREPKPQPLDSKWR